MGSVNQESASVITLTDDTSFDGAGYLTFGFEYDPGPDGELRPFCALWSPKLMPSTSTGRITWAVNGTPSWQLNAAAIGPNPDSEIGQRLISEETMVSFACPSRAHAC